MNYEITNSLTSRLNSEKILLTPFLLLILSVIFIPAAYVFIAAVFISDLCKIKVSLKIKSKYLLLISYVTIGFFSSNYKLITAFYVIMMIMCFYSYSLFLTIKSINTITVKKYFFIISLVVFSIGIMQYFNPKFVIPLKWVDTDSYTLSKRIYSTFFNPNVFGFYINFIVIMATESLDFRKLKLESFIFALGIMCLILTFSRTSWVSLIAALILASFFNKKYLFYALIISITIFFADYIMGIGRTNFIKVAGDSSFLYRFEVWKTCIRIIKDNFITGIGFGTLFKHIPQYSSIVSTKIEHCHNIYLQVITETGILGFSIFFTFLINIIYKFKNNLIKQNNEMWVTAFSIFAMTMIHGLVDSVAFTPQIMMILCIYAGIVSNKEINS